MSDLSWFERDLDSILSVEKEFFREATARLVRTPERQKQLWRNETVFQRRERLSSEAFDAFNGTVQRGPFEGTRFVRSIWRGMPDWPSMLLGFYELEVLNLIVDILSQEADFFVDIGAAEGYYPTGVLSSGLASRAYAFELDFRGRSTIAGNSVLNGVDGALEIFEEATEQSISRILESEKEKVGLFLCDIAGAEFDLFTPELWSRLQGHHIILEIHNWVPGFVEGYPKLLRGALPFFHVAAINPASRPIWTMAELDGFTDDNRLLICSEGRPNRMRFLYLRPINQREESGAASSRLSL